jgi:hypothetical protein
VFEDEDAVGHADAQRAAGTAFADDDGDDRHGEAEHLAEIDRDGFGDVALFALDAGKSAGRVDERDDGHVELGGEAQEAQGLAIAFGEGAAEVAGQVALGVAALLGADDHDPVVAIQPRPPTMDWSSTAADRVEFGKILHEGRDVVPRVGAAGCGRP